MSRRVVRSLVLAAVAAGAFTSLSAQAAEIGSQDTAPLEPDAPLPQGRPCVVPLVQNASFGATQATFSYTPPAACPGPWAKVVLSTDISVTAGTQYDRTATLFLGGVPLFFGTTSEPGRAVAPSWHRERDVTEDTALLKSQQLGQMFIANYQNATDNSTIYGTASLLFYPADRQHPAPPEPDLVIPLDTDARGTTTALATGTATLSRALTLPRNIVSARLETFLQNQSSDEFYYTCTTDALASELQDCGGGTFREGQVSIDGTLAGLAPVYPLIFTGGIDPYLWSPTPGIHTLQFRPQQVELTPFAGQLNDGKAHTFALAVNGANNYFSVAGTLYLTLDHERSIVPGGIEVNTLQQTAPQSTNTITSANGTAGGTVSITAHNAYRIAGMAWTSRGPVETIVDARGQYHNDQTFTVTGSSVYDQKINQTTDFDTTVTGLGFEGVHVTHEHQHFPLDLVYDYTVAADGTSSQATTVDQRLRDDVSRTWNGLALPTTSVEERIQPHDTLNFSASGSVTSHAGSSTGRYRSFDGLQCVTRKTAAKNNLLTEWKTDTRPCWGL